MVNPCCSSLCVLRVLCASVVSVSLKQSRHGDTEDTEDAQRVELMRLPLAAAGHGSFRHDKFGKRILIGSEVIVSGVSGVKVI